MLLDTRTSMKSVTKSLVPHQRIHDPCTQCSTHELQIQPAYNFSSSVCMYKRDTNKEILNACAKKLPTKYNYLIT